MTKEEAKKILGTDRFTSVKNPTEREQAMACIAYFEARESVTRDFEGSSEWKIGKAILENIPSVTSNTD